METMRTLIRGARSGTVPSGGAFFARCRRLAVWCAFTLFLTVELAVVSAPAGADRPASAPPPVAPTPGATGAGLPSQSGPLPGLAPGDDVVVTQPSADGLLVLQAAAGREPVVIARLAVAGMESRSWIGNLCRTGSGRLAAVSFGPAEMLDDPVLANQGAFGAVIDLPARSVALVSTRVSLRYHSPGCGPHDEITFARYVGDEGEQTELLRVDGSGAVVARTARAGHLTAPTSTGARTYAAADHGVVEMTDGSGAADRMIAAAGVPFGLQARPDGGVDFLDADRAGGTVRAVRVGEAGGRTVAEADLGHLGLARGPGGDSVAVGRVRPGATPDLPILTAERPTDVASRAGSVAVRAAAPPGAGSVTLEVSGKDGSPAGSRSVDVTSPAPVPPAATSANYSTPKCAVPRNDATLQVMQPSADQVTWAVNQAVRGQLTGSRPANWNGYGLPAYSPQGAFPPPALDGGGRIPAQVVLAVLAQESNLQQAGRGALPGVAANPLVADYYGTVRDGAGRIVGMDYDKADCGYGVGQITTGMTAASNAYTPNQKKMIALDYEANIAATIQVLTDKWNQLRALNPVLTVNNGSPLAVENWYLAAWAYNTGINANQGGRYGLGWTNNPANSDYRPDRDFFLRTTYDDARTPQFWPYQEKVMGWAETAQYQGDQLAYPPTALKLNLPYVSVGSLTKVDRFFFCNAGNECSPTYEPGKPPGYVWQRADGINTLWYCTRVPDRQCWWHTPVNFGPPNGAEVPKFVGLPEPGVTSIHPPSCGGALSAPPPGQDAGVLVNARIVDDVPHGENLVGCPAQDSAGTFALDFDADHDGAPVAAIDTHQIGAGYNGHFWYAHTNDPARTSNRVTGTWTPPAGTTGWTRVLAHVPDHGADTYQANYVINGVQGATTAPHRVVNQRWNQNIWIDLGIFDLGPSANVQLTNDTRSDFGNSLPIDVAWDAMAFVPTTKPRISMVSFGDSYAAGEGVEPYFADSDNGGSTPSHKNACHRSPQAYSVLAFQGLKAEYGGSSTFHLAACSGSVIDDLRLNENFGEVPQLEQGWLDQNTTHVAVKITGNDARFAAVLKGCMLTLTHCLAPDYYLTTPQGRDPEPLVQWEPQVIDQQLDRMRGLLAAVRAEAPNAMILVVGYPHVVYNPSRWGGQPGIGLGCGLLDGPTVTWFDEMDDRLNGVLAQAAASEGAVFVDPRSVYGGKEACSPDDEWINATVLFSDSGSGRVEPGSGSFHPKAAGHAAEAQLILDAVPPPPPPTK